MRYKWLTATASALAIVALTAGCTKPETNGPSVNGQPGKTTSLTVKGSDTLVQLAQAWAQEFMKTHPGTSISVSGGGSNVGITALMKKNTDIADASRPITPAEIEEAKKNGVDIKEFVVAQDALSLVVNPSNPINELTLAQLKDIFTAKVTNWKELGGPDVKIVINSRETSSGSYLFFQEHVLGKGVPYATTAMLQPSTSQIVDNVAADKGGVGYIGLGYVNDKVKAVKIKKDAASPAVVGSPANVVNRTYPLARPLFNYTNGTPTGIAKDWIDWVQGPEGQKLVVKLDFVPIK